MELQKNKHTNILIIKRNKKPCHCNKNAIDTRNHAEFPSIGSGASRYRFAIQVLGGNIFPAKNTTCQ